MQKPDDEDSPPPPKRKAAAANKAKGSARSKKGRDGAKAAPTLQTGTNTVSTPYGEVHEWLPVPENLPNHPTMAFFGKRRTGKSTTITNLLFHCCQHIPFGLVMSDTAFAGYWEQIIPKKFIVQGLRPDVLDWLVKRQKTLVSKYGNEDPRVSAFIILDDVIADQNTIRYSADLARFFMEGRHLAITVFIASQYVKGVGPMVRTNCDYIFLQPIYNKTQRDILWDMEAAFMDKKDFSALMDEVIVRELLEGNTAQEPKKTVRIMICADFEDSSEVSEKFYHWTPVPMKQLPKFRLCHPKYWEASANDMTQPAAGVSLGSVETKLKRIF